MTLREIGVSTYIACSAEKGWSLKAASAVQAKLIGGHMVTASVPADGKKRKHSSRHDKHSEHKKHKSDKHGKAKVSQLACCVRF